MKLWLEIEIEQYPDLTIEVSSTLKHGLARPDQPLSPGMSAFITCLSAGIQAGVETFEERMPQLRITKRGHTFQKHGNPAAPMPGQQGAQ